MPIALNKNRMILSVLGLLFLLALSAPAFGADKIVARLDSFSGKVLVKSQGSWGTEPKAGMALYSGDKVVTGSGTATIKCDDGAVMELKKNSNLVIEEREKKRGFLRRAAVVERRLRLMVGKLFFRTGKESKKETRLETPTMVCGLRGTSGIISIGSDGAPYIQFSEGGTAFTIGDFISGVAEDVPDEIAALNPAQRTAFVAAAAASQAKAAAEAASKATGTPEARKARAQAAYAAAQAAELAAEEAKAVARELIANNPDPEIVEQATEAIAEADEAVEEAQEAKSEAVDSGAEPVTVEEIAAEVAAEEPSEEPAEEGEPIGFDVEAPEAEEPEVQDQDTASPV
jgi:flagellar biosynthesis GTPase FlhF